MGGLTVLALTQDPPANRIAFDREVVKYLPSLRAYAISLCGNVDRAADLVSEAVYRAIESHASFQPGTNMSAWLFTILRNHFRSEWRKRKREVEDADGVLCGRAPDVHSGWLEHARIETGGEADEIARLDWDRLQDCLVRIPREQREAIVLVGVHGFTYDQAADIVGTEVGTVKSRVNRARNRLAELMGGAYGQSNGHALLEHTIERPAASAEEAAAWERLRSAGGLEADEDDWRED